MNILKYLAYPLMTSSGIIFGLWAVERGWPAWLIGVIAIIIAVILVEVLERVIPYSTNWSTPQNDRRTDFFHLLFSNRAFDVGTLIAIGLFAPQSGFFPRKEGEFWPHHWPLLLQALLAVVVFEFPWYWVHRLGHSSMFFWRVHSVHHSSKRIYWWNFSRNHPFDNLLSAFVSFVPLLLMGVSEAALAVMASFSAAHGLLQHSNVDLRTGVLDLFFSTARVHRWHHSPNRQDSDANYSPRLMLWDHVFGTYRFNANAKPPENLGLGEAYTDFPETYCSQLMIPFRSQYWRKYSP